MAVAGEPIDARCEAIQACITLERCDGSPSQIKVRLSAPRFRCRSSKNLRT